MPVPPRTARAATGCATAQNSATKDMPSDTVAGRLGKEWQEVGAAWSASLRWGQKVHTNALRVPTKYYRRACHCLLNQSVRGPGNRHFGVRASGLGFSARALTCTSSPMTDLLSMRAQRPTEEPQPMMLSATRAKSLICARHHPRANHQAPSMLHAHGIPTYELRFRSEARPPSQLISWQIGQYIG